MDAVTWIVSLQGPALLFALVMGLTWLLGQLPLLKAVTGYRILAAIAIGTALGPFVLGPWPLGWETAFVALGQGFLIALAAGGGKSLLGAVPKILEQMGNPRGTPGGRVLLLFVPLLVLAGGCQEALAIRQSDAWIGAGIKTYAVNEGTISEGWVDIYTMAREADCEYATQKTLDQLKTKNMTPAQMEIEVKSLIAHRDKVKADTAAVVRKMREARAKNDSELAKVLTLKGKVSEWMEAGMTTEAIPAITSEVVNLVRTFYPEKPAAAP